MGVVLSVYTDSAFRDYLLPAINNSDYEIILKGAAFGLENDIILKLEIIDGVWRVQHMYPSIMQSSRHCGYSWSDIQMLDRDKFCHECGNDLQKKTDRLTN